MKFRLLVTGVAAAAVMSVLTGSVDASSAKKALTVEERVKGSDAVVVATVRSVNSRWQENANGDRVIVSRFQLDVEETMKGGGERTISLDVPGGSLDGFTLRVSGQAVLAPGDRAVFFVDAPTGGARRPHMQGQGVLKLDEGNVVRGSSIHVEDIRRAARSAGK